MTHPVLLSKFSSFPCMAMHMPHQILPYGEGRKDRFENLF